jgi:Uncharacterized protein family UPF0016
MRRGRTIIASHAHRKFGDLTQVVIVNLAARYHDLLAVGTGALAALWLVGGLAIVGGRGLLRLVPIRPDHARRGGRDGSAGRHQPDQRDPRLKPVESPAWSGAVPAET